MRVKSSAVVAALLATSALADTAELHTFHCLYGCPIGAPATNDTIVREIYTLSSDDLTKIADWVAYRIEPETIGPSKGREWSADLAPAADETLTPDHYQGASRELHVDRGHQAPLAAFSGTKHAADTNILSNITPQASALNQGAWQRLEARETTLAKSTAAAVYVLTGPLYERMMRPLPAGPALHRVPSGYWKVIAAPDGRYTAFVFDQTTPRGANYCDGRVTLLEVQLRSRLRLLTKVDASALGKLDQQLGCSAPMPAPASPSEIPAE